MELVVITMPDEREGEQRAAGSLFRHGLKRLHLRKPGWDDSRVQRWIDGLAPQWRGRVVIHGRPCEGDPRHRSCHSLEEVQASIGTCDYVFFSPVFASASKPGRPAQPAEEISRVSEWLISRDAGQRRTRVLALSGVTPERVAHCRAWGFDGVAVMGGVWESPDPAAAFACYHRACWTEPVMCLTLDGLPLSHQDQTRSLCGAGAKLIQLRMKGADVQTWTGVAKEVVGICRQFGARCIINDSVQVALASEADGAHLGAEDGDWREARRRLGSQRLLGGTVNNLGGAARALAAGVLDYVGVGPLRFTASKAKLAPILGVEGIRRVIEGLDGLPAWAIGGVMPGDLPELKAAGATGVAVSSGLWTEAPGQNALQRYATSWHPMAETVTL